jgi:PAS domain S-box-containing protein
MRLRNQNLLSITIFTVLLVIIVASVFATAQQTAKLDNQEAISKDIQTRASNLQYVSNDYFLYQVAPDLTQWQTEFNALSSDISKLSATSPQQRLLVDSIKNDSQLLNNRWTDVVFYLQHADRNVSIRVLTTFQGIWSRMALQNQGLIFDAQQLSQSFQSQIDQLNSTTLILIFAMLGLFAAYFITYYLITFRNTLKSISELQSGISVIGSGNLDYSLKTDKKDEIGDISRSLNQMASNLKAVTASKIELEHAQTSLRESEQRWATTLSSVGDSVIATDVSGSVTFMNAVAETLTGWTLSEASGKSLKEVFHIINEETRLEVESPVNKVLEKGVIVGLANHTILVRRDGSEVPLDDSGAPIKDENGNVTGVVLVFHDITERKKTEEATAKQAELINLSPDAIIVRKLDGTITFWSEGAEKLYGFTKDEAIGQDINKLLNSELPQSPDEIQNRLEKEGKWSGEIIHICKDGNKVVVQSYWLGKFSSDGKMYELLESNVDITQRIEMQFKLEESAVRVEEYANQMETLANQRAAQLKDAERLAAIGATAGMVGHDIRNPLQAITGDVFLARTELASTTDSQEKKNALESLDEIEKNIFYINKIVADLQDYARPLKPMAKETDLQKLIDELVQKNGVPENIKVQVKVQKKAETIMADPDILKRSLGNLFTNAVQAMPEGGRLSIQAYREGTDAVITVADTGVGIPEEARDRLFTPLFTTKSKGQGFGLAVVKRMTESLGGLVTFESEEGRGTKFILRFPQKNSPEPL